MKVHAVLEQSEVEQSLRADLRVARAQMILLLIGWVSSSLGVSHAGDVTITFAFAFLLYRYIAVRNLVRLCRRSLN